MRRAHRIELPAQSQEIQCVVVDADACAGLRKAGGPLGDSGGGISRDSTLSWTLSAGQQTFSAAESPARWNMAYLAAVSIANAKLSSVMRPMIRCLL